MKKNISIEEHIYANKNQEVEKKHRMAHKKLIQNEGF